MPAQNPFKPTAGAAPPLLVGRGDALDEFAESIDDGPGAPARLLRLTGARGVGKTVMLTRLAEIASERGWVTIAETAAPGLVARLTTQVTDVLRRSTPGRRVRRAVDGIELPSIAGFGGGGVSFAPTPDETVELRTQLVRLLDAVEASGAGLLITVDEVHRAGRADLRDLSAVFQHLVREGRDVALALAGLPSAVSDLLNDDVLTFLRRATPVELADVPLVEVRAALAATITAGGKEIDGAALDAATTATGGYPFMIQLVGYHVWRTSNGLHIDSTSARAGIEAARKRLGSTEHATALADLSAVDRTYLVAMAQDDGPSGTSVIAARLNASPQYANIYRSRLIDAGIIEPIARGTVDFALPYLREYLRDHVTRFEMQGRGGVR